MRSTFLTLVEPRVDLHNPSPVMQSAQSVLAPAEKQVPASDVVRWTVVEERP